MTASLILVLSIGLQVVAAVLALRLIRVSGGKSAWILIAGAVVMMAARRVITLAEVLGPREAPLSLRAELVALLISALMVGGLARIGPLFERARRTREMEAGLGRLLENSLTEFYIFGVDDLKFMLVNEAARDNLGYSAAELERMTPLDLKTELTLEEYRHLIAPLLADQESRVRFQTLQQRKDGSKYPVEVDLQRTRLRGRPAILATVLDSSGRDEAERALRASEEHFRSLIERSHDVATILEEDGTIVYLSPAYESVLGHRREERAGESAFEFVHPDDIAAVRQALAAAVERPGEPSTLTYRIRHADGSWRAMEGTGSVRRLADGSRQFVVNQRDVTDREAALREKAGIEVQLLHAQRIELLGTLAGGVAHDFNNLLTPIIGYADLLREKLGDQPEVRADLDQVLRAAGRAQKLVQQLVTFSRQVESELTPIELQETVREALELVRSVLPSNIAIEVALEAPGATVLADATQIHQVVMNLCTNAEQAMGDAGGTLSARLRRVDHVPGQGASYDPAAVQGPLLHLEISDTGPGMDSALVERIFDPFFTTKEVHEGTGLGLSIVQGIVLSHGGALSVDTAPGEGATFNIFLPLRESAGDSAAAPAPEAAGGRERILVVDDEVPVGQVVKRLLESQGYRVTLAHGSEEALRLLRKDGAFDLVITDQTMPSMTGLELAGEIQRGSPRVPVILVSGFSRAIRPEKLLEAGVAASLTKPFSGRELARCVRGVLDAV